MRLINERSPIKNVKSFGRKFGHLNYLRRKKKRMKSFSGKKIGIFGKRKPY